MKRLIGLIQAGENMSQLLMTVVRFIMPMRNKLIKKLLLIYLEVIDKTSADGKLLPEMILVVNALRNDTIHPNEYVRGAAMRFICRIKEAEVIEPLLPTIRANLEHRHSYVRRNAALALWTIFKNHDMLVPDAADVLSTFLMAESDPSCKRNAFLALSDIAPDRALDYLTIIQESLAQHLTSSSWWLLI